MTTINYAAEAQVYAIRQTGAKRHMTHRRFPTTAEAVRYAVEELLANSNVILEIDEDRFEASTIRRMYDAPDYPLPRIALASQSPVRAP